MNLMLKKYSGTLVREMPLSVFRDWVAACEHLCDHVLTRPEAEAWAELLGPEIAGLIMSNAGFRLARQMWRAEGELPDAQALYDVYADELCRALDSAAVNRWHWDDPEFPNVRKALGVSGVEVVFNESSVLSGMLPGFGCAGRTAEAKETLAASDRLTQPLPRQGPTDDAGPEIFNPAKEPRLSRPKFDPKAKPPPLTRNLIRYQIFRRCAQFVRAELLQAYCNMGGKARGPETLRRGIDDFDAWLGMAGETV